MAILQTTGVTGSLSISSSRIPRSTSASLFNVNGYNGRLINVVDTLSGSLFSVNTIAGLPVFEVFSNNRIVAGKYNANDFVISGSRVGIGLATPQAELHVSGSHPVANIDGLTIGRGAGNRKTNTIVGNTAFTSNTIGTGNSVFGYKALQVNILGLDNCAFGIYALQSNTIGTKNSAFGRASLILNISGNNNSAFGYGTLQFNRSGSNNNAFGNSALNLNFTNNNNAFGSFALQNNTTGVKNSAFGHRALQQNTTAYNNSAFGYLSMTNNTNGVSNCAFGMYAMPGNTIGSNNTAVGVASLQTNVSGNRNNAFGRDALLNNTTNNNNAFGYQALASNTTGYRNSAFGHQALKANTISSSNSAFGYKALYTNRESGNSAFGSYALRNNTTGYGNSGFGSAALAANTTGYWNQAFGEVALRLNTIGNNNSAFGRGALYANTIGIQNTALGNFALVANTTGAYNTAVGMQALASNVSGNYNNAFGKFALQNNTTDNNNAFGYGALLNNTTGRYNSAFGHLALRNNTVSSGSSAFGYKALFTNSAGGNTAFGSFALQANTTGTRNVAIGVESLLTNTIGSDNLAAGHRTLYANTTGANNVAFGSFALQANTTGYNNVAIGYNALFTSTFGAYNTAIGKDAMYSTTTGERNLAVGYRALYLNTSGTYNVAIGVGALRGNLNGRYNLGVGFRCIYVNTSGSYNNAFGNYSMYSNTTGNRNTAIGQDTLYRNTTGNNNVAIGNQAAFGTTGNNNVMLGSNAGYNSSGSNNIILGYNIDNAVLGKNNQLNIANLIFGSGSAFGQGQQISTGSNVGIGTNRPLGKLHVTSSVTTPAAIFQGNVGIGVTTNLQPLGIGSSTATTFGLLRTGIGAVAGGVGPSINFYLAQGSTTSLTGDTNLARITVNPIDNWGGRMLFFTKTADGNNLTSPIEKMRLTEGGNLGIGTTSPGYKLDVSGSIRAAGGSDSTFISIVSSGTDRYFLDCYGTSNRQIFALYENSSNAYLNSWSNMIFRANQNGGSGGYFVFSGANVGIGTTTPVGKFDIRPDSNWLGAEAFIVDTDGGNNPRIRLYRPGGGDATTAYPIHLRNDSGNLNILTGNAAALGSETVSSKFYLKADGNLGIGTTSPSSTLHAYATTVSQLQLQNSTRTFLLTNNAGDNLLSFYYDGANRLQFDLTNQWFNTGNVGIGTGSPVAKLHISSSANGGVTNIYSTLSDRGTGTIYNSNIALYDDATTSTSNAIKYNYVGTYLKRKNSNFTSFNVGNFYGATNLYSGSVSTVWDFWSRVEIRNKATGSNVIHFVADSGYGGSTLGLGVNRTGFLVNSQYQTAANFSNQYGLYVNDLAGATNNFGAYFAINAATNKWNVYAAGTAANFFQGNVGIGTTSPSQKLDVNTGTLTAGFGAKIGEARIGTWIGGTTYAFFAHQNVADTSTSYSLLQGSDGTTFLNAAPARNLYFRIANNDAMIIDSNRNFIVGNTTIGSYSGTTPIFTTWSTGVTNSDTDGGSVVLWSTSTFAQNMGSALSFGCKYNTAGNYATLARIRGAKENSTDGNYSGYFAIDTRTSGGNFSEKVRVQNDGNVGIGTVTPDVKLHLSGTGNQELKIQTNTSGNPILSLVAAGQDSAQIIYNRTGNYLGINISSVTNAIVLNTSGNVGIGAIVPAARLHLSSSSTTALRIETKVGSGADSEIEFVGPDTHSYAMGIDESDNDKFKISYAASRTPPTLGTNDRFIIQTDGNIGINTTVASSKFHVVNDAVSNANQPGINGLFAGSVDGRNLLRVQNTDPNVSAAALGSGISLQAYSKNSNQPATNTHEAQLLLLANNNSLGGTTVLVAPVDFQVNVSASNVNMGGTNYSNYGSFSTYFKRDGNVGVGTFNPSYKLDVSGSSVWSTTTRIDARIGNAAIGRHPYWGDYAYFSHAALDNTVQNNYLILQYKDGSAYFNAPLNKSFYFVNNGSTYVATVNATGIAIGKGTGGANYTLDVTGSATISGKLGVGGSPGTGKVYVNAGGSSNPFLTVANALGTADTTTAGYTARGFIAIDLGAGVVTGRTGTHYIQVFSKP